MTDNLILQTDSYKTTHYLQYPPKTSRVYSYLESRGGDYDLTLFFGLSYLIQRHLLTPVTHAMIDEAESLWNSHLSGNLFNRAGWEKIVDNHEGRLPIEIRAVPEGTIVPIGNVLMTVENTDPDCFWLTNYLETLLCRVWYPTTVATRSWYLRQVIAKALQKSGTPEDIDFKLHDFGYRGVSSEETAAIGGAAHLVNFKGTDTFAGIMMLAEYYHEPMAGFSIPASEHSTITAWGQENETAAFQNMIDQYGHLELVACVSDSYNIWAACSQRWGTDLRVQVENMNATLVVRPDSGDPMNCIKVIHRLAEHFGTTTNDKGYKVLQNVRVIQGDGIDPPMIKRILTQLLAEGWSADNLAFGSGGGLLQQLDRDTCQFAFKCSQVKVDGEWRDVYKDPIDGGNKTSKRGRLSLIREPSGNIVTVSGQSNIFEDMLERVYHNGHQLIRPFLSQVRDRASAKAR